MTETDPPEPGPEPDAEQLEEPQDPAPDASAADIAEWKAKWSTLSRKHEARAKEGLAAKQRLAELEDANKSELQRATERERAAMARAEAAELRALRAEVAARKGLSIAQAKRLQGTTEEELDADADELLSAFKPSEGNGEGLPPADKAPPKRLRSGAVPDARPTETDPRKLAESIRRSF